MKFNAYLFKPEVTSFEAMYRPEPLSAYERIAFKREPPFPAEAYLLRNKRTKPAWLEFFLAHCEIEDPEEIWNQSNSFILALQAGERFFAMTYGHGYLAIDRDRAEPSFGLDVAINSLPASGIRSTESRNLRTTATLKQLVLSRDSGLEQFEVDFTREVLNRLEGTLETDSEVGKGRVRGAQSCAVAKDVELPGLGDWCGELLTTLGKETPRHMARVRQMRRVGDADLVETLDRKLVEALRAGDSETLHLAPADIREYTRVERYRLEIGNREPIELAELDVDLVTPRLAGVADDELRWNTRIVGLDENGDVVSSSLLVSTAVFEVVHQGRRYIRFPTGWVEIDQALVERTNRALERYAPPDDYRLPIWPDADSEGKYNEDVGRNDPTNFFTLDKKLVTVEGRGRIEACDLLSKDGDFVHVKEYKSSQSITHLVDQARAASDLLLEDRTFREALRRKLDGAWVERVPVDRVAPEDHRIVLAIGSKPDREVPGSLPYLSKHALIGTLEWLRRQGFDSFVYRVDKPPEDA